MVKEGRLAIIAIDIHFEILNNILELLSNTSVKIDLLTSPENKMTAFHLNTYANASYFLCPKSSYKKYISSYFANRKPQHAVILTIYKDFEFYQHLCKSHQVSYIVHNTHFNFNDPSHKIKFDFNRFNRNILYNIQDVNHSKLIKSSKFLYFLSRSTLEYAIKRYPEWKIKFRLFPYIYSRSKGINRSDIFNIIIPGGVNLSNRDYQFLTEWIKQTTITHPISLVFLGQCGDYQSKSFLLKISAELKNRVNIISFDKYVDQKSYDKWINKGTIIFSPLKKTVQFRNYQEIYGYSKISGSVNDCIKNQIPLVIPCFYPTDKQYDPLIKKYSDIASFCTIMDQLYENKGSDKYNIPSSNMKKSGGDLLKAIIDIP